MGKYFGTDGVRGLRIKIDGGNGLQHRRRGGYVLTGDKEANRYHRDGYPGIRRYAGVGSGCRPAVHRRTSFALVS